MTDGTNTWNYTYNADGLRTKRQDGMSQYQYFYNGDRLSEMQVMTFAIDEGFFNMSFAYDASGVPLTVTYNDTVYYYVTNIQGDVVGILDGSGVQVVSYTYDAWGNVLNMSGSMAAILGTYNPLRYRGYVYDQESGLYYLQSRYYDPKVGRFLNADAYASTGQGLLGYNMFAYCANNPVFYKDERGTRYCAATSVREETAEERSQACQHQNTISRSKGIGKSKGSQNYLERINNCQLQQNELQIQITLQQIRLLQNGAIALWDTYQRFYEQEQQKQLLMAQLMLDGAKTSYTLLNETEVIDIGMAGYQTYQATRSFKKAMVYFFTPIPTLADEGFAIGYLLKGVYHLYKGIERTTK